MSANPTRELGLDSSNDHLPPSRDQDTKGNRLIDEVAKQRFQHEHPVLSCNETHTRKLQGKSVTCILGSNFAGKSTFLNYILGYKMMKLESSSEEIKFPRFLKSVITCSPHSETADKHIPINHDGSQRKHEIQVVENPNTEASNTSEVYCECSISDLTDLVPLLTQATSVKFIIFISYHQLLGRRCDLSDLETICSTLFHDIECLRLYKESLLLGITNVPVDSDYTLEDYKEFLATDTTKTVQTLAKRLFLYDPLDRPIGGSWNREECLSNIAGLQE